MNYSSERKRAAGLVTFTPSALALQVTYQFKEWAIGASCLLF